MTITTSQDMTTRRTGTATSKFKYEELVAWICMDIDDDGDERMSTWNGFVDAYYGMLDGEPHWIINRNGAMHYVPERLMIRI